VSTSERRVFCRALNRIGNQGIPALPNGLRGTTLLAESNAAARTGLGERMREQRRDWRSPPLDVVESKLRVPPARSDGVSRTALVNRLRAAGAFPIVLVVAPAGYGKTTLLAQWAARDARPFAWVSVDERDNDPVLLLRHIAAALHQIEPLGPRVLDAFDRPEETIWDAVTPGLTAEVASRTSPFVLVLDGADVLESADAVAAIGVLGENLSSGSMVALSGRVTPRLPVAALRVAAPLLEIGSYELAFSRREAEMLLRASGVEPEEDEIVDLLHRTEGWPAALYLAALASHGARDELAEPPELTDIGGDDRYLADYLRFEYLSHLRPEALRFLRRTSILEKLSGPLCDAVLRSKGSGLLLEELEQANLFLVPLDRHREWWRYHHLFRDLLRRELDDHEPERVPTLNRRAAAWHEAHGDPESALLHAHAAGDDDTTARILTSIAMEVHHSGRVGTVEGWLDLVDDDRWLDRHPAVAINGCYVHAARGRAADADRWLHAAERGLASRRKGVGSVRPSVFVMRSALCADGPTRMRADAEAALARLAEDDAWLPGALLARGVAKVLTGESEQGDSILEDAVEAAARLGSAETSVVALSERSLLAAAWGDHGRAETFAHEAHDLVESGNLGSYPTSALALAASARALLRHGQWDRARQLLTVAARLTRALTLALPWLAIQVRLELGRAYVTLRDRDAAERVLEESRGILAARPALGVLGDGVDGLEEEIVAMPEAPNGTGSALTAAELRVLPLLSTHLSFREIGERLYVSRNTIKTQAISVYRKLGVSNRSEAVARARELGLVEAVASETGLEGSALRSVAS
jgi:LuxR family transcriptional regulator, maltose regulon positive regulatory protein